MINGLEYRVLKAIRDSNSGRRGRAYPADIYAKLPNVDQGQICIVLRAISEGKKLATKNKVDKDLHAYGIEPIGAMAVLEYEQVRIRQYIVVGVALVSAILGLIGILKR